MSTRTLTVEQQFIVQQARPPIDTWPKGWCHFQAKKPSGRVVVTIAGPGSGKTTVQEDLIASLLAKGHRHVLKIFFNKGAAEDAKDRLIRRLGSHDAEKVECITSHKAAKDFVKAELTPGGPPVYERCKLTEEQLKTKIQKVFASEIEAWVGRNPQSQEERKKANREARLVTHWIFKTFLQFLGSKKPLAKLQGGHPDYDYETYYPAKMQHKEKLPCCRNQKPGNWYKERAYELWTRMRNDPDFPITHDVYLKWAQLERNLNLSRFTAILVDEAQDMSEAQLDAFVGQQAHADCFVVGDMAQSLYSWRYASPQQLASLPVPDKLQGKWFYTLGGLIHQQVQQRQREPTVETKLTQTFRFGSKIAAVANGMLQIKEESQQSEAKKPLWVPYRVVSAPGKSPGVVTTDELAFPYTVIARSNAALVVHAWELWGLLDGATGGTSAGGVRTSADGGRIKIALLNEGDVGGKKPFSTIFKEINDALCLYHGKPLPDKSKFEEYDSWEDFLQQVEDLELNEFTTLIQLVERHGKDNEGSKLKDLIDEFKEAVLGKDKCSVAEADVVLTTVCGSKGLEWPRVQLLNDCVDLNFVAPGEGSFKGSMVFAPQRPPSQKRGHPRLDFTGDELNSWFGAHATLLPPPQSTPLLTVCMCACSCHDARPGGAAAAASVLRAALGCSKQ